jgi:hypothetical protein
VRASRTAAIVAAAAVFGAGAGAARPAVAPTLTVFSSGSGTVTSSPRGISCPGTCSAPFTQGQSVTLTAQPQAGARFSGWSGDCAGSSTTCTLSMTAERVVSAAFAAAGAGGGGDEATLTVSVSGAGTVTSSPAGISCPGSCSASFAVGTSIRLSAVPGHSSSFSGWSGRCSGTGACTVTLNAATSVSAAFAAGQAPATTTTAAGESGALPAASIALGGRTWRGVAGDELRGFIATFAASRGPYGARIDWGDGRRSSGEVAAVFAGSFAVYGTHGYARPGRYAVRVTVTAAGRRIRTIRASAEIRAPGEPLNLG